jgi:DNA glycosylase AlkZ-like
VKPLTAGQLNRATLERQLLLRRRSLDVVEAVRRIVALQAQEPASPYLALWNRVARFDPAELDTAFRDRRVIKASLMRLTLHAVREEDWPALHAALVSSLRGSRLFDRRYLSGGLSAAELDAAMPDLLRFASRPRASAELEDRLRGRLGDRARPAWWALRRFAPLHHSPTGGPWSFAGRSRFVAARGRRRLPSAEAGTRMLVLRYLEGFGPATVQDIARFSILRRPVVRRALSELDEVVVEIDGADGARLYDLRGARIPAEETPAPPRLLPMWDSVLLAYDDRSRVIPDAYRSRVIRVNGDVLPTMLVDGRVAGVWRPVEGGVEATAFHRLDDETWSGLAREARSLLRFLAPREPRVYGRYAHWWTKGIPHAEVRVLAGSR